MGLAFYCGSEFPEHEYDQFQILKNILISKFRDSEDEIAVLYNFFVDEVQIDVALIMKNGILLIEMKDYEGDVFGGEKGDWYCKIPNGELIKIDSGSYENPFVQCRAQRSRLKDKILDLVNNKKLAKFPSDKLIISKFIKSWLYFNGPSTYRIQENMADGNIFKRNPWFNIVNSGTLAEEIDKIRSPFYIIDEDAETLVGNLRVNECGNRIPFSKESKSSSVAEDKLITVGEWDQKSFIALDDLELQSFVAEELSGLYDTKYNIDMSLVVLNKKIEPSVKSLLYIARYGLNWILRSIEKKASDMNVKGMEGLSILSSIFGGQYKIVHEVSKEHARILHGLPLGSYLYKSFILVSVSGGTIIQIDEDKIEISNSYLGLLAHFWILFDERHLEQDEWGPFIDEDLAPRLKKFALKSPLEDLNVLFFRKDLALRKYKEGWFELKIREFDAFIDGDRFDLELYWSKDLDGELIDKIVDTFIAISKKILISEFYDKRFRTDIDIDNRLVKLSYAPIGAKKKVIDMIYDELISEGNLNI